MSTNQTLNWKLKHGGKLVYKSNKNSWEKTCFIALFVCFLIENGVFSHTKITTTVSLPSTIPASNAPPTYSPNKVWLWVSGPDPIYCWRKRLWLLLHWFMSIKDYHYACFISLCVEYCLSIMKSGIFESKWKCRELYHQI